uniref:Uncharacterized protein n=1 Tax=Anguilla anguilla TaxID=7936 RepID=A0A0E9SKG9_ANGAN
MKYRMFIEDFLKVSMSCCKRSVRYISQTKGLVWRPRPTLSPGTHIW